MYYVSKRMVISASHRLDLSYDSKCSNFHGHNWIVTVFCKSAILNQDGMVADFTKIKELVHDYLDHSNLNEVFDFNPTAENIARWVTERVPLCYKCMVQESEGNVAMYVADEISDDSL